MEKSELPKMVILDFDKTLTTKHSCPALPETQQNKNLIADQQFLKYFIDSLETLNIPIVIASFGIEDVIVKVLNDLMSRPYFRREDTDLGKKNVFGNECNNMEPCTKPSTVKSKEVKSNITEYTDRYCNLKLNNKYKNALGKVFLIETILKHYNLSKNAEIIFYDDTPANIDIFTEKLISEQFPNLKAYNVSSFFTEDYFCQDHHPSWPEFDNLCNNQLYTPGSLVIDEYFEEPDYEQQEPIPNSDNNQSLSQLESEYDLPDWLKATPSTSPESSFSQHINPESNYYKYVYYTKQ